MLTSEEIDEIVKRVEASRVESSTQNLDEKI